MGLSVLLHVLVLWLAYRFPSTVRPPEEVMEVDLADIPRTTDFLPAESSSMRACLQRISAQTGLRR